MNATGAEGWSLNITTGAFHLKSSFLGIDFATPEERPWHNLRTQIKEVELSREPRMNYFNGCTNLEKVYTSADMKDCHYEIGRWYGFDIGYRAFYGCRKLKSLVSTQTYSFHPNIVHPEAFYGCEELTDISLIICDRVEDRAFYGCSKLSELYFSSDLEAIGSEAFAYNTSLSSIKMTGKAPYTSDNVFRGVTASNVTLHIPAKVANTYEKAPWNAFNWDKSFGFDENGIISGATQYQHWELTSNGILKVSGSQYIPDYDDISEQPWYNYRDLIKDIVIDGDIHTIGKNAFAFPDGEESQVLTIAIPRSCKNIKEGASRNQNCYGVNAPTLPVPHKAFWEKRITANLAFLWTVPNASTDYALINSEWAKFNHSAHKLNTLDKPTQEIQADFETGKLNQVAFFSDSDYPWSITDKDAESGRYSMMSGNKGVANSSSSISAMYLYNTDGIIYFMAKCMGEGTGNGWDKYLFYIDGELQFSYGALGNYWSNYSFPVSAGMHTFKWEYTKDSSTDPEGDGFFVDNIYFLQNGKDDDLITGVETIDHSPLTIDHSWFDLSGRKLSGKPTQPGLYINGGRKVVIK